MPGEHVIDFKMFNTEVFVGRDLGVLSRAKTKLEELDRSNEKVKILIPADAESLSSSFLLGLFGPSIRHCGSKEEFLKRYEFDMPDHFNKKLDRAIRRALLPSDLKI